MSENPTSESPRVSGPVRAAIEVAVDQSIRRTLLSLGLNAEPGEPAVEIQQDMAWVRQQRTGSSAKSHAYWTTVISVAASIFTAVAVLLIRQMFFNSVGVHHP